MSLCHIGFGNFIVIRVSYFVCFITIFVLRVSRDTIFSFLEPPDPLKKILDILSAKSARSTIGYSKALFFQTQFKDFIFLKEGKEHLLSFITNNPLRYTSNRGMIAQIFPSLHNSVPVIKIF